MVKIKKMNQVIYADCMNPNIGLPVLDDDTFDYCFTDPPFNVKYGEKGILRKGKKYVFENNRIYFDKRKEYKNWCKSWFEELKRICNVIVIHCGFPNLFMWADIEKPRGLAYLHKENCQTIGNISYLARITPILIYVRKGKKFRKLKTDYFKYIALWGFLNPKDKIHPCPLNPNFWYDLIKQCNPESVIDPFMGSGTTIYVCNKLDIPWFGYEINLNYKPDVEKALKIEPEKLRIQSKLW